MKKIFLTIALAIGIMASAQVKIGVNATSVNANSLLELESTTKGVLFPRVALTGTGTVGQYWTSTVFGSRVKYITFSNTSASAGIFGQHRSNGFTIRCIKD